MSEENQLRSLISLGAFSHVIGGGGEIPEDLEVNSIRVNTAFVNGPITIAGTNVNH